jgi:hypothetical protein
MEKVSFWHDLFQLRFLSQRLVRLLYMGYSRKVEGSSFPTVVVSDRAAHFMAKNLNLKMAFFQTKNGRYSTTPWNNPTKISRIIGPLEVYQMVYLPFHVNFFTFFWRLKRRNSAPYFDKVKFPFLVSSLSYTSFFICLSLSQI